ncbi:ammonium transporter [Planctomycetales bacterium ZRK34]|nr:ammonium transporter [Planctomycetales bacterium ZRK34]
MAQEAEAAVEAVTPDAALAAANEAKFLVNNLWIMLAGCLVFIMHLGFATVESGLSASKNTVNILFKNAMIICIGFLTYALCGFNIMYPGDFNGYFTMSAVSGFISRPLDDPSLMTSAYADYTWYTDFFFQAVFAATAATIVSGAVAGRIKLGPFLVFSTIFVAICYPITGSWKWGGGFLDELGFYDFAGSTLVHSVGGWGALVMAILVGPRLGKFNADGSANAIPGHNLTLACIGVFLLWFGWFGFNGGSVLSADPGLVSLVLVTTSMAAAAGGVATGLASWIFGGKPDLSMSLNGILAGLVGITAGADQMVVWESVLIGLIAGVLVYFSVLFVDKLRVDDPVGAISVHLVCGIWGTLAVGIFGALASPAQIGYQLAGIGAIGAFTVVFTLIVGIAIKATIGLRVSDAEQVEGLDLGEHNAECYPDFQPAVVEA